MKAIIMAGGEGKRLKPVSGDTPKPLVPLCGRPIMEHIVMLLHDNGINDICAALKYRAEDISGYFGSGERFGVNMQYRIEREPLGTAGGVKNCADFYGDEDFLVISGDAACDFDLGELMRAHREHSPAVTLALYPHSQPLRYGLALCGRDSFIRSFVEKPDWEHVVTNLVNTGIYIVSSDAMRLVPEDTAFDFAKDLFPLLLERGEKLFGLPMCGYWCDIGTPQSYYQCCADALEGKLIINPGDGFDISRPECACPHGDGDIFPCRDRARLMAELSGFFLDMGADFSDGLSLPFDGGSLRICACPDAAALRVAVTADDAEFARELSVSARRLLQAMENRLEN